MASNIPKSPQGPSAQIAKKHYLFGFPISHSASPYLHNAVFDRLDPNRQYYLCDTYDITQPHFKKMVRDDTDFAGAAVTMPLKVVTANPKNGIIDDLTPAAREIGAINTIVVEPDPSRPNGKCFIGTNSDYLGVRNSILRQIALSAGLPPGHYVSPASLSASVFPPSTYAAFVIGGGGTTRTAIYSLSRLNLSPIYLINRDVEETMGIVKAFPNLDLRPIYNIEEWEYQRGRQDAKPIPLAVGAIPAVEPQTDGEKMVYTIAHRFFEAEYKPVKGAPLEDPNATSIIPPERPHFLEMAYKPRRTPMLIYAERAGWACIEGIQAMIEQGFAQDRMWLLGSASEAVASLAGDAGPIPHAVAEEVRRLVENMGDVKDKKEAWGEKPADVKL